MMYHTQISIIENNLTINAVLLVLREYMEQGVVIPRNKYRTSDCFVWVLSGEAEYSFSDRKVIASAGDVMYIAKGSSYTINIVTEKYHYIYVDFLFDFPEATSGESRSFPIKGGKSSMSGSFERLLSKWRLQPRGYYLDSLAELYTIYSKIVQNNSGKYVPTYAREITDMVVVYMAENYMNPDLRVAQLAEFAKCSEVHLRRLFRRDFNATPTEHLIRIRIDQAKSLLINTDYPISKIAELVGLPDSFYFSRLFRKEVGCCPSSYRKMPNQELSR